VRICAEGRTVTTQAVMGHERVRYRSGSYVTRIVAPSLGVLSSGIGALMLVAGILAGTSAGSDGPFFIAMGAFWIVYGLAMIVPAFWPLLVLTADALRRPRLLRRAHTIPFGQVTGIGLVYKRAPGARTPQGWFLYLWTTGDVPRDTGIGYEPARWLHPASQVWQKFLAVEPRAAKLRGPVDSRRFSENFNPVTQTDPDKIAATCAGRAAREIYDRVLADQGPSGPLAVRQDQKHISVPGAHRGQNAYWSPDGELGLATAQPQPAGPVRPVNPLAAEAPGS
jgi:hypothetical protein